MDAALSKVAPEPIDIQLALAMMHRCHAHQERSQPFAPPAATGGRVESEGFSDWAMRLLDLAAWL